MAIFMFKRWGMNTGNIISGVLTENKTLAQVSATEGTNILARTFSTSFRKGGKRSGQPAETDFNTIYKSTCGKRKGSHAPARFEMSASEKTWHVEHSNRFG